MESKAVEVVQVPDAGDMDLTNCNSCGRQVSSKSHFCQYCGTSLQDQIDQSTAPESSDLDPKSLEGPDGQTVPEFSDSAYIPLPAGTRLRDRYIIEKQLGQGGFGRAYRAQDTGRFNEPMVLKELTPSVQGTAALKKAEELFQREAATLHRLEHPQIPKFWEIFQAQKRLFLVQDFVEGRTYQQIQEERQTFNEQEMVQLFQDLLPVLSYLHRQGVVHRDISPDNIMRRDRDGLPILIDLGGVKQIAMDVATEVISAQVSGFSSGGGTRLGKIG
ncbi:MAG: inactive serine/threonine-protein kinase VRK3, partial [Thermosynechococcaceae cyanobacterium]